MWWCPILHEVQFFKTVPLRNKVQNKTVKPTQVAVTRSISGVLISVTHWLRTPQSWDFVLRLEFQKYKK